MDIPNSIKDLRHRFLKTLETQKNFSPHTLSNYQRDLEQWIHTHFSEEALQKKVSIEWLNDYDYDQAKLFLYSLNDSGYAQASIARKIACLRSFWAFLKMEGVSSQNPWKLIKFTPKSQRLPEVLSADQMHSFLDKLPKKTLLEKRNLAIFELLYATGMRLSELTALDQNDLDLRENRCQVIGKGNRERVCFFGITCAKAIQNYLSESTQKMPATSETALFRNHSGKRLSQRSIQRLLKAACEKQALPFSFTPHTFRHSFATALLTKGADIRLIQELLGHRSLNSTQLYTHLSKESLFETYKEAHPRAKL